VILSLFLLEGYDHEEIAQVLGISNDLSRIRYFRAKQKLIENLKQSGQHSVYSMHS
jgi:RNA polymerase sigma-70 factor (ECF subfamily)